MLFKTQSIIQVLFQDIFRTYFYLKSIVFLVCWWLHFSIAIYNICCGAHLLEIVGDDDSVDTAGAEVGEEETDEDGHAREHGEGLRPRGALLERDAADVGEAERRDARPLVQFVRALDQDVGAVRADDGHEDGADHAHHQPHVSERHRHRQDPRAQTRLQQMRQRVAVTS